MTVPVTGNIGVSLADATASVIGSVGFMVLGVDPGFASTGAAVVRLTPDGKAQPLILRVLRTEKASKKANVFASEDNVFRSRTIYRQLKALALDPAYGPVKAICAETMSFPRNAGTAAKMAMCWGVISGLAEEFDIPIIQATPQGLKKVVAGAKTASKEDIQRALEKLFGREKLEALCVDIPASFQEHPFDALGAVVACSDSEVLRLARRMST